MIELPSRLLFVADAAQAPGGLPALVARAAAAGVDFVEVRQARPAGRPGPASGQLLSLVRQCLAAAPRTTLLVNDRADVAVLAGAHGAHVGQDDVPAGAARRVLGPDRILGLSTHDLGQVRAASGLPLDYLAIGPIFTSSTKSGHADPIGLDRLAAWRRACPLPVIAIGGISAANARSVRDAGADAVAVAAALSCGDLEREAEALLRAVA